MTYLEKLKAAVKVDNELLAPDKVELLRRELDMFFSQRCQYRCPGQYFDKAPKYWNGCNFYFDYENCEKCWNKEVSK